MFHGYQEIFLSIDANTKRLEKSIENVSNKGVSSIRNVTRYRKIGLHFRYSIELSQMSKYLSPQKTARTACRQAIALSPRFKVLVDDEI